MLNFDLMHNGSGSLFKCGLCLVQGKAFHHQAEPQTCVCVKTNSSGLIYLSPVGRSAAPMEACYIPAAHNFTQKQFFTLIGQMQH